MPAPANDNYATPQVLAGASGTFAFDTTDATDEGDAAVWGGSRSLWFLWTAPADGAVDITTPAAPALYLRAWPDQGGSGTPAAPGDDVTFAPAWYVTRHGCKAGTTYRWRVGDASAGTAADLTWAMLASPSNDNLADATDIGPASGSIAYDLEGATYEPAEPGYANDYGNGMTVWFRWDCLAAGSASFDATGVANPYAVVQVWTGGETGDVADLVYVTESEGAPATFDAVEGVSYFIAVDTYEDTASGTLTWTVPDPPVEPSAPFDRPSAQPSAEPMVWTSAPNSDGSDRIYLNQFGSISGLRYTHKFPGGCLVLSCTLSVPADFSHRALTPGRDVGASVGASDVWLGTLQKPTVSDGAWQLTAEGDAATTKRFVALGLGTHNALNANEVIDATLLSGRHGRFRRVDTLPVPDGQRADDAAFLMDEALTQAANAAGKRWRVDLDRVIRFYPFEGDGQQLVLHARHDISRTTEGQVTRLDAAFTDAETGLFRVEHIDAPATDTGSTFYPAFYTPDGTAYAARGFTLYTDGTTITAYVIGKPATATVLSLSSPAVDLDLVETSQFYSKFEGAGTLAVGATGRTATYRAMTGGASLGTGDQEGPAHRGAGSLGPTGNIPPSEAVVDLTGQGAFTQAQVLDQLAEHLARTKAQPHYDGAWTAQLGDLRNSGGVPVDPATVRAGVQIRPLAFDSTRNLSRQADDQLVTIGETEYFADTRTLTLTPAAAPDLTPKEPTVDFATGLIRT